ncbi:MAG: hypothetical protein V2J16_01810, partial [Thermoleophilia bacterium]|nr:hypothetical protein [Thermoleophilia bacterium]
DPNDGVGAAAGTGSETASGDDEAADAALPSWPAYDPASDRCLVLDAVIEAAPAPYAEACDLADRLRAERVGETLP